MLVNQIAVFLENRKGRLKDFLQVLAKHQINISAITIADTTEFGILRVITNDNEKALKVLKEAGYTVKSTNLLGVAVSDEPGKLYEVVNKLTEANISFEYLYSYSQKNGNSIVILKVSDEEKAQKTLGGLLDHKLEF